MNAVHSNLKPWLMLVIRSLLFLAFQALIGLLLWVVGSPNAWDAAAA
jgi:hypothetical protein